MQKAVVIKRNYFDGPTPLTGKPHVRLRLNCSMEAGSLYTRGGSFSTERAAKCCLHLITLQNSASFHRNWTWVLFGDILGSGLGLKCFSWNLYWKAGGHYTLQARENGEAPTSVCLTTSVLLLDSSRNISSVDEELSQWVTLFKSFINK